MPVISTICANNLECCQPAAVVLLLADLVQSNTNVVCKPAITAANFKHPKGTLLALAGLDPAFSIPLLKLRLISCSLGLASCYADSELMSVQYSIS